MANTATHPFSGMGREEEGNYASTMGSVTTRDQETDHGLTLPPKVQSVNSWDTTELLHEDFGAQLDSLDFNLEQATFQLDDLHQQDNSWVEDFLRLQEPSAKRRKLTPPPWAIGEESLATVDETAIPPTSYNDPDLRDTVSTSCLSDSHLRLDQSNALGFISGEESTPRAAAHITAPTNPTSAPCNTTSAQSHTSAPEDQNLDTNSINPVKNQPRDPEAAEPTDPRNASIDLSQKNTPDASFDVDDIDSLFGEEEIGDTGAELKDAFEFALEAELEAALLEDLYGASPNEDPSPSPLYTGAHSTRSSSVRTKSTYSTPDVAYSTTASTPRLTESRSPTPAFISRFSFPSLPPDLAQTTTTTTTVPQLPEPRTASTSNHRGSVVPSKRRTRVTNLPLTPHLSQPIWPPQNSPQTLSFPTPRSLSSRPTLLPQLLPASHFPGPRMPTRGGLQHIAHPTARLPTHSSAPPSGPFLSQHPYHSQAPPSPATQPPGPPRHQPWLGLSVFPSNPAPQPDFPLTSIEYNPQRDGNTLSWEVHNNSNIKVPYVSRQAAIEYAAQHGFQCILAPSNEPQKPLRPATIQAIISAPGIIVDLTSDGSSLAPPAPRCRSSYNYTQQDILGGVIDKMSADLKSNSPVRPHVIPDQFSEIFEALEKKFHEDLNFKNSVMMWGIQKLVSMKEKKTDLGMEGSAFLVRELQRQKDELKKEKADLLNYAGYLESVNRALPDLRR